MSIEHPRNGSGHVAPLILRLAVAGILGCAGLGMMANGQRPIDAPLTPAATTPAEQAQPVDAPRPADNPIESAAALAKAAQAVAANAPSADVDEQGIQVSVTWPTAIAIGVLVFAASMFFGVFTRLASLAGLGTVGFASLSANGHVGDGGILSRLVEAYQGNPTAMLLLGAICLTLLVSGSGPLSFDRVFQRRRRARKEKEAVPAAS